MVTEQGRGPVVAGPAFESHDIYVDERPRYFRSASHPRRGCHFLAPRTPAPRRPCQPCPPQEHKGKGDLGTDSPTARARRAPVCFLRLLLVGAALCQLGPCLAGQPRVLTSLPTRTAIRYRKRWQGTADRVRVRSAAVDQRSALPPGGSKPTNERSLGDAKRRLLAGGAGNGRPAVAGQSIRTSYFADRILQILFRKTCCVKFSQHCIHLFSPPPLHSGL
jgi:hypothetical protein